MDIALLSKMIGELLPDHDEVGLPGLGTFIAEMVPASFSDKGYTINPPYRRVTFLPSRSEDDSLIQAYSAGNGIDYDQAAAIIQHFLEETKQALIKDKLVVFPGLGRLRSTRQNHFFFIMDEDLDIFPDGFGLEPVSLKNHAETEEEVRAKVEEFAAMVAADSTEESATAPAVDGIGTATEEADVLEAALAEDETPLIELADETTPADPEIPAEPEAEPAAPETPAAPEPAAPAEREKKEKPRKERKPRKPAPKWLKTSLIAILIVATVAAVLLATFVVLAQAAPDFIDSLLYTPEELQILNYR